MRCVELLRREAPLGVGLPAPRAGARAWRVDHHAVEGAGGLELALVLGGDDLAVGDAGARQPLEDRAEAEAVEVVGDEPALVLHHRGERQRLAAGTGADVGDASCRAAAPDSSAATCEPASCTSNQPRPWAGSTSTLALRVSGPGAGMRTASGDNGPATAPKRDEGFEHLLARRP